MTVRHLSRKSEHLYLAWHCGTPFRTLYSQVGVCRNCSWAMANDSRCRILFCSRMRLSKESFWFVSKDSRLPPVEWFQSQTINFNTGNRKEVGCSLPFLPIVTDKLPPDAPILLHHTPSRGRFNSRCSSTDGFESEGQHFEHLPWWLSVRLSKGYYHSDYFSRSLHDYETSRDSVYDVTLAERSAAVYRSSREEKYPVLCYGNRMKQFD